MSNALRRDLTLRIAGLLSLAVAGIAVLALCQPVMRSGDHALIEFALSALAVALASAGAAMVIHGGHLLDPVAISPRWAVSGSRAARQGAAR